MTAPAWFLLAGFCGLCTALEGIWIKKLKAFSPEFLAWCAAAFSTPFFLAALAIKGLPEVRPQFYVPFVACAAGNVVGLVCYFRAFAYGEASLVFPLLALSPVWMLLSTRLITHEFPPGAGLAGVLLSASGCYGLGLDRTGPLSPLRNLWKDPGCRWALITSALWSVTSNFDKPAVQASSPLFHAATHGLVLSTALFVLSARHRPEDFRRLATPGGAWRIGLLGALVAALALSQFMALELAQATYVVSVKRGGMVVGVLLGWLLLKEPYGPRRLALSLVILAGVLLILFA